MRLSKPIPYRYIPLLPKNNNVPSQGMPIIDEPVVSIQQARRKKKQQRVSTSFRQAPCSKLALLLRRSESFILIYSEESVFGQLCVLFFTYFLCHIAVSSRIVARITAG